MISFDVSSLFTNIPLTETVNIAIQLLLDNEQSLGMSREELQILFEFATAKSHFLFNEEIYDQVDGVAMGSPLAPVLANIFMGHYEKIWIENYSGIKPEIYKRYVDDIFCLFKNEADALSFFEYLNKQHVNIKFTYEKEIEGKLCFLDVLIKNVNTQTFETSIFRKSTFTGLLTNFLSFAPMFYKVALIKTLINRLYYICNNWKIFYENLKEVKLILGKNMFPPKLVEKTINSYLDKKKEESEIENKTETSKTYFKLPYIGEYSDYVSRKLKILSKQLCKNTDIKISFSMFKVGNMFSTKSSSPKYLKSGVVYHFTCAGCNDSYVGETFRHFETRVKEHLHKQSQPTSIYKHLQKNPNCRSKCNESCFKIIDSARTKFTLEVKEAIHTYWIKPKITKQKNLAITINI